MRIGASVLHASPREGARIVALGLLAEADDAADRLAKGGDEALHDFRVALRHVRTALRAFRPSLAPGVKKRQERTLEKLARSTNAKRDAEVQLAWLESRREVLSSKRQRAGLELVVDRYEGRARDAPDPERLAERYARVAEKVRRRLQPSARRADAEGTPARSSFGVLLATLTRDQLDSMCDRVAAIQGPSDVEAAHLARIEAKRLRYLLEPLRGQRYANASEAVRRLKRLQDVLGELHDAHLLAGELRDALVDASAERARSAHAAIFDGGAAVRDALRESPRPGLLALARLVRARRDDIYTVLERDWLSRGIDGLSGAVRSIAAVLAARFTPRAGAPRSDSRRRRSRRPARRSSPARGA